MRRTRPFAAARTPSAWPPQPGSRSPPGADERRAIGALTPDHVPVRDYRAPQQPYDIKDASAAVGSSERLR